MSTVDELRRALTALGGERREVRARRETTTTTTTRTTTTRERDDDDDDDRPTDRLTFDFDPRDRRTTG